MALNPEETERVRRALIHGRRDFDLVNNALKSPENQGYHLGAKEGEVKRYASFEEALHDKAGAIFYCYRSGEPRAVIST